MSSEGLKMDANCCSVEAIVSFDERGQLVIPKDLRQKFDLQSGEKFALISCTGADGLCCLTMIKTNALQGMLKSALGPAFSEMFGG